MSSSANLSFGDDLAGLAPDQGDEAFERHQLLAIRFHRAARLNQTVTGEGKGWQQFFDEHFPRGGKDANRLWTKWRLGLVKDEQPLDGIVITHGQAETHWVETDRGLCINLETMWDEFHVSVDSLVTSLRSDSERRSQTLAEFERRRWTVQHVRPVPSLLVPRPVVGAFSASAMGPVPPAR